MKFDEVVYFYLKEKQFGRKAVRPNTLEGYVSAINHHLMPQFRGRDIESIKANELQSWVDSFVKSGSCRKAFYTFRQIYRWYLRAYHVRIYDETLDIELPRHIRRKPYALTRSQAVSAMRDMRGEVWEPCALVQLSCGLRPCEAIALKWSDVNLKTGEVSITKGLHESFGQVYESPTKTEKSTRTVILPRFAVERLRHIKRERQARKHDRLCSLTPCAYRSRVRRWFARRGLHMCAQWLRHTFGTLSLQAGTPIETVALMLGHTSVSTFYEHYLVGNSSLMREAQRGYACALGVG